MTDTILDHMAQALAASALYKGLDLGDERDALAVLDGSFLPAEIDQHFEAALETARSRAQLNQRLHDAADRVHQPTAFAVWLVVTAAACVAARTSPVAAQDLAPVTDPGLLARVAPVVIGIALILFLLKLIRAKPWIADDPDHEDEIAAAYRWNGEGR